MIRKALILSAIVIGIILLWSTTAGLAKNPADEVNPPTREELEEIDAALQAAVQMESDRVLSYIVYEVEIMKLELTKDRTIGLVWTMLQDRNGGQILNSEPGLGIANKIDGKWTVILQSHSEWPEMLKGLPGELLTPEERKHWLELYGLYCDNGSLGPYGGYLLPWESGFPIYLTRSITHNNPPDEHGSMHYAFDFARGYGDGDLMFELLAAKDGKVVSARWTQENYSKDPPGNYLVLEDTTTTPTTYQLYLHLAQNTIPEEFRTIGAVVKQGQYIGKADDNGASYGNHLHFQVHSNLIDSYWGCSVDVTFDDVSINVDPSTGGGRPRMTSEASNFPQYGNQGQSVYVSENVRKDDVTPPTANLTSPVMGEFLSDTSVLLEGSAADLLSGIGTAKFVMKLDGTTEWIQVGPTFTTKNIQYVLDLCESGIEEGPVYFGIMATDKKGNASGVLSPTGIVNTASCTPQVMQCLPGANQAAIYTLRDYEGDCQILGIGDHFSSAKEVGGSLNFTSIASALVGEDVDLTLHLDPLEGRSLTLQSSDSNLIDNLSGIGPFQHVHVQAKTSPPILSPLIVSPASGKIFTQTQSVDLFWDDGGGSYDFQVRLFSPTGTITSSWMSSVVWQLGSITQTGVYTWNVRAKNGAGQTGWSGDGNFIIQDQAPYTVTYTAPFNDDIESVAEGWFPTGYWHINSTSGIAHSGTSAWEYANQLTRYYDNGEPNSGDLTMPGITITQDADTLRFWYKYETETMYSHWDQRWVQIAVDGGRFVNLYQLYEDLPNSWLQSPPIDLSQYLGKVVEVRFHFNTGDERKNARAGWLIDDVAIGNYEEPDCGDIHEDNNNIGGATFIVPGETITGTLCEPSDIDFFRFSGVENQQVGIYLQTTLDLGEWSPKLAIYDADGTSLLADLESDGVTRSVNKLLAYQIRRSGDYYIKVMGLKHPGIGSPEHLYSMSFYSSESTPEIMTLFPNGSDYANIYLQSPGNVSTTISGSASEVFQVRARYHNSDWLNGEWVTIGTDRDGGDGWQIPWDTSSLVEGNHSLLIEVDNWVGSTSYTGTWELIVDRTAPQTTDPIVPSVQGSSAIYLEWDVYDELAPIKRFDIRRNVNDGQFVNFMMDLDPQVQSMWVYEGLGAKYGYRIRAVDEAGNLEQYSNGGEAIVTVQNCSESDPWDANGQNDGLASTAGIYVTKQVHNFCTVGDQDWIRFEVIEGTSYHIAVKPEYVSTAVSMTVYTGLDAGTLTLVGEAHPEGYAGNPEDVFNKPTYFQFTAGENGYGFVHLKHIEPRAAGNSEEYSISIIWPQMFLPLVVH